MSSITSNNHFEPRLTALALSAIGVVFGDIGTSPLYTIKAVFDTHLPIDKMHVLGVLSLVFWALTLVVTAKYAIFIMRADNKGEGGIMALMVLALQSSKDKPVRRRFILTIGLLGAALFYGDVVITPAISVLSAVEGLQIIAPTFADYVLPVTIAVLSGLFILQAKGTGKVGKIFSPIMCLWFVTLGVLGIINIIQAPYVLAAINPFYAVYLLRELGWQAYIIMGAVVLAITGAEALYADMGHFGLKPIRYAWFGFVFPALLLNYFGQGALLLQTPDAVENPFYLLAPDWALYPLLILATLATIIASQAVISGAFSVTRQAIQLEYFPRLRILHTSGEEIGQVYIPTINWLLMVFVFIVVLSFQSSTALASAYGIAVTTTMIIDTLLAFIVIQGLWQWNKATSFIFLVTFISIDSVFLFSNSLKIPSGGWLPLVIGIVLFLMMTTWIKGRQLLAEHLDEKRILFEDLEEEIENRQPAVVKGSALYLTKTLHGVPQVFLHNFKHNHVLHEQIIVLTIVTKDEPYVDKAHRVKIRTFGKNYNFYRIKIYFGFQQYPDVMQALRLCLVHGVKLDFNQTSFFIGSERIAFRRRSPMPKWRRPLFRFLFHNSASAVDFFKIPAERVIELGIRLEL
ncbi:potassium transporter [Candidatus Methylobacter favarea]|uniref:Probable potassium transport system protein Kup n=1 Tax=Candidatus Methylobacter favarea TaxID=2707345 RepID=A0A8S0XU32_9GAMM|nr:potassium transporter Kup [Candidatus Methylobacter favarea]CAA9892248.1 potassium transporter [Candidatus Methylobacter favarea]